MTVGLATAPAHATEAPEGYSARAEAKAQALLKDLSSRRRVAKLFHNHQSMFQGVQERLVNTSAGNLTFLVRDLVAVGGMPIIAGRVYDSSLAKDDDFGPGWKLTLREEITRNGTRLAFTDASNSTYALEIDGSMVKPVHPASTPVRTGEILQGGDVIVLRSLDLTRRFEQMDGVYRLVEARHLYGSVRLTYRGGQIASASSATATLRFSRRADGRVVAVRDDDGRSAFYEYDDDGRLSEVRDLAGASWRHRYANGRVTGIDDPRGKAILHAAYDDVGRVSWIEVQGEKTTFAYEGATTRAVDGLGRTTVFHRAKSGVTEGVESASGTFSQLAFDAAGRPVQVLRDGGTVASLDYTAEGRLASLTRRRNAETRFAHGAHGISRAVGAETATYGYDGAGRLVSATDADGERHYDYDAAGFPSRIEIDDWKTTLQHDASGQTTRLARGGDTLIEYVYRPDGRVASIKHGGEPGATADYRYDARGLREAASYGGGEESTMGYDATGNLIHYVVESPDGKHSQEYELGDHNQVLRIRNGGDEAGPDVVFRYDEAGRVLVMEAGVRESRVSYDALDRVTRVTLDGDPVVDYGYEISEQDAVAASDRRTGETLAPFASSPVFGTMDSVVYARPRPSTHEAVSYSPALKTFDATWRHMVPDALRLAALQRRDLPVRGETPMPAPFGHDRPSNALFLPPEYRAVNCHICSFSAQGVDISADPTTVGSPSWINIRIRGSCTLHRSYYPTGTWLHTLRHGDSTPPSAFASAGSEVARRHTYGPTGVFDVEDVVECGLCLSVLAVVTGEGRVEVYHPDDCEGITAITPPAVDPAPLDREGLTAATRRALTCLETAVNNNGGMFKLRSAFRSQAYQDHIREVWDKRQVVKDWPDDRCAGVRQNVDAEWERHNLAYQPARRSRHSSGIAFDANWGTLNAGVTIDGLAQGCGLSRPVPGDTTHFEYGG